MSPYRTGSPRHNRRSVINNKNRTDLKHQSKSLCVCVVMCTHLDARLAHVVPVGHLWACAGALSCQHCPGQEILTCQISYTVLQKIKEMCITWQCYKCCFFKCFRSRCRGWNRFKRTLPGTRLCSRQLALGLAYPPIKIIYEWCPWWSHAIVLAEILLPYKENSRHKNEIFCFGSLAFLYWSSWVQYTE